MRGKINVNELLSFKSTAKVVGDIITNKLAIEPNALFSGTCNMKGMGNPISEKPVEQKHHELKRELNDYGRYSSIAVQMVVIILAGVFGGHYH